MKTVYMDTHGHSIPDGVAIETVGHRTTVRIELDSLSAISPSVLKRILQNYYRVESVEIERVVVVAKKRG